MGEQMGFDLGKTPKKKLSHGGARRGAGRKTGEGRVHASERHRKRPRLTMHTPVHVTLRIAPRVGAMRRWKLFRALRAASIVAAAKAKVRIVDVSIQNTHVHLVCEADSKLALARGMQGFLISAARRVNRALGGAAKGTVFADRYNARQLTCPTDVRNTRLYVINNFRHHGDEHRQLRFDPFSSALSFDGWLDLDIARLAPTVVDYDRWPSAHARSWLLTTGWRRLGLISQWDTPRS